MTRLVSTHGRRDERCWRTLAHARETGATTADEDSATAPAIAIAATVGVACTIGDPTSKEAGRDIGHGLGLGCVLNGRVLNRRIVNGRLLINDGGLLIHNGCRRILGCRMLVLLAIAIGDEAALVLCHRACVHHIGVGSGIDPMTIAALHRNGLALNAAA